MSHYVDSENDFKIKYQSLLANVNTRGDVTKQESEEIMCLLAC